MTKQEGVHPEPVCDAAPASGLRGGEAEGSAPWRCETCRHWSFAEPDWEFDDLRFGECKAIPQRETIVARTFDGDREKRWTDEGEKMLHGAIAAAKAIAVDGSGYYAAVRTAPDFGCVLHAPSSPTQVMDRDTGGGGE